MKKYLIPIIIFIMVLILSGCSGDEISPLDNPDIDWVSEKIKDVEGIDSVEIDPIEDNPDLRLGGYGSRTGRLYFSYNGLNNDETPLEAGTDGGGSIEVYSNIEDATMRNEYLTDFLNGAAGSSVVIGTLVIRTSSSLLEEEQHVLEQLIIESLNKTKEN